VAGVEAFTRAAAYEFVNACPRKLHDELTLRLHHREDLAIHRKLFRATSLVVGSLVTSPLSQYKLPRTPFLANFRLPTRTKPLERRTLQHYAVNARSKSQVHLSPFLPFSARSHLYPG
jgi:hypothetical protein